LAGKPVDAYILSTSHSDADVTLRIGSADILARRTVGLGRSVSLALATADGANSALVATGEFIGALASATKWASRRAPDARFSGEVARRGKAALVTLRAADSAGAPINMLELSVGSLAGLDETVGKTPMRQIAPGRYTAEFALGELASNFHVIDAGGAVVWRGGLQKTYPREFDAIGPNYANLRRLASLTGGRLVEPRALAEIAGASGQTGRWEIWPWLAGLALMLMLLDWIASLRLAVGSTATANGKRPAARPSLRDK
jgi:hypothetical protein